MEGCLLKLSPEQLLSIKKFAVDIHEPFMTVIRTECPRTDICVDRFHLAQKVNGAFDKVHKHEFKKQRRAMINLPETCSNRVEDLFLFHERKT